MLKWLSPILLSVLLAGCEDPNWHTSDISDIMPALDLSLMDENGQQVEEDAYTGKTTLLYFGYTHCPDVCPTSLARMTAAIKKLDEPARDDIQVLFVSVDPERDTPARLRQYTDVFGPQFIGLTGSTAQLDALTNRYRVSYGYGEKDENGNYDVSHSSGIFVFNEQGDARLLMRNSDPIPSMVSDLKRLMERG
ncbi:MULTISPECIES: SCO family protein [Halomonadaceae]|uniref:Protein SCO1/2 n=1 Tax=Onishia taeanensis TaxID=284577 RepID=A0A328XTA8_9GAMM|nr:MULTISPECIES: SCO family protein [Halomonas]RAR62940.1 protein SCO1/2 [Halomonas taeanensis]|tara:strand:+ start:20278 stop:20856 length:579 start_codon:yes stop_codon:yes gene_type:complete